MSRKKDNRDSFLPSHKNKAQPIPQTRSKGGPSAKHLKRYRLDLNSLPLDWFRSTMPLYPEDNLESLEECDAIGTSRLARCVASQSTRLAVVSSNASAMVCSATASQTTGTPLTFHFATSPPRNTGTTWVSRRGTQD